MIFTATSAVLVLALVTAIMANPVRQTGIVKESPVNDQLDIATGQLVNWPSEQVAIRRVKRGVDRVQELLNGLKKSQKADDALIRKLSNAMALMAMALKGKGASEEQKKLVVSSAKEAEEKDKEAAARSQSIAERSIGALLTRSQMRLEQRDQRAELEFSKLKALAGGPD